MNALTPADIARCFVNASRREAAAIAPPEDLETLDWDTLDLIGWRDRKLPERSYVVVPVDAEPRGVILRATAGGRNQAMCGWCEDIVATSGVRMFSAKLAGPAGRRGDTIGTLLHADFSCSAIARRAPSALEGAQDAALFTGRRVEGLRARSEAFTRKVLAGRRA